MDSKRNIVISYIENCIKIFKDRNTTGPFFNGGTYGNQSKTERSYFFIEKSAIDSVVDSSELNQYNILNTHEELWFLKMRYRKTSNSLVNLLTITLSDTIKIKISER